MTIVAGEGEIMACIHATVGVWCTFGLAANAWASVLIVMVLIFGMLVDLSDGYLLLAVMSLLVITDGSLKLPDPKLGMSHHPGVDLVSIVCVVPKVMDVDVSAKVMPNGKVTDVMGVDAKSVCGCNATEVMAIVIDGTIVNIHCPATDCTGGADMGSVVSLAGGNVTLAEYGCS